MIYHWNSGRGIEDIVHAEFPIQKESFGDNYYNHYLLRDSESKRVFIAIINGNRPNPNRAYVGDQDWLSLFEVHQPLMSPTISKQINYSCIPDYGCMSTPQLSSKVFGLCPLLIKEVMSQKGESPYYHMGNNFQRFPSQTQMFKELLESKRTRKICYKSGQGAFILESDTLENQANGGAI
jgi:hypothetical protein